MPNERNEIVSRLDTVMERLYCSKDSHSKTLCVRVTREKREDKSKVALYTKHDNLVYLLLTSQMRDVEIDANNDACQEGRKQG